MRRVQRRGPRARDARDGIVRRRHPGGPAEGLPARARTRRSQDGGRDAEPAPGGGHAPPAERPREIGWSWLGSFIGIAFTAFANERIFERIDRLMIVGSFGASAVLIYGAIKSPLAQPRNLVGGHVLSALVGVACQQLFPAATWLAAAMAVSTAIAVMHATKTLHPPGGATALIAVIGGERIHDLGFTYALFPVVGGALILLAVALLVNNLPRHRRYPEFWL